MNDIYVIQFGEKVPVEDEIGNHIAKIKWGDLVDCEIKSIGQNEFYQAAQASLFPEIKFKIFDYLNYQGQKKILFQEKEYEVIRTYRDGLSLEITAKPKEVE